MGPPRLQRAGPWPVQLRHAYDAHQRAVRYRESLASGKPECCPRHPGGGCGFARHGTYRAVAPAGMRVARWYCRDAQDDASACCRTACAARLGGQPGRGRAGAWSLRSRWAWRRRPRRSAWTRSSCRGAAVAAPPASWCPGGLAGADHGDARAAGNGGRRCGRCAPCWARERALVALREIGADHLHALPLPARILPPAPAEGEAVSWPIQHETGPDPPGADGEISSSPAGEPAEGGEVMLDDKTREQIALFRYGLIADLLHRGPEGARAFTPCCARRRRRCTRSPARGGLGWPRRRSATGWPRTGAAASMRCVRSPGATRAVRGRSRRRSPTCSATSRTTTPRFRWAR